MTDSLPVAPIDLRHGGFAAGKVELGHRTASMVKDSKVRLEEFNETSFDAWVDVAKAPALPSSLKLYNELQGLGFHIILLTGRSESQRNATEENLLFAGYHSWEKLILRQSSDIGKTAVQYKSERRAAMEVEGFKILGNSGDQWSDLIGLPVSTRSFKLPNPMYYIS